MNLFISPHNDDAVLFGAFTLMRSNCVVLTVTDSWIQFNRGENITAEQRWQEDVEAMKLLGCPIIRGGIRDDVVDEWAVRNLLTKFGNFEQVYAPAVEGGNKDHDLIGKIAQEVFTCPVMQYATYTSSNLIPEGRLEIVPNKYDRILKDEALSCYQSQINLPATAPHFEAVKGKSEWYK